VGKALKNLRRELSFLLLVAFMVQSIAVLALWWLFSDVWVLETTLKVAILTTTTLVSSLVLTVYVGHIATMPIELIVIALAHLYEDNMVVGASNIKTLKLGQGLAEQATQRIYQLAASSNMSVPNANAAPGDSLGVIFDLMPALVIALDTNGKIDYLNNTATRYINPVHGDPTGKGFDEVFELDYGGARTFDQWRDAAEEEKVTLSGSWQRVKHHDEDDNTYFFDMAAFYSKDESHGFETIITLIDHTPRYQKDEDEMNFVSLAVHELRTPITVLRGYIEVFEQEMGEAMDDEMKSFAAKMSVSAEQLALFINNILNVTRIDNGQIEIKRVELDWGDLLKRSMKNDFDLRATSRGKTLRLESPDSLPTVAADAISMYEVLSNLIDNAIKYSDTGEEIIVRVVFNDNDQTIETFVQDFGIGIPPSVLDHLFEKFYRSHRSRHNVGGTGLGLYLSKIFVEAHEGNIRAQSTEGEGSVFSFTLPTYASVADKLGEPHNDGIERGSHGWIKNHSMHRR